jgi:hypothetical protein
MKKACEAFSDGLQAELASVRAKMALPRIAIWEMADTKKPCWRYVRVRGCFGVVVVPVPVLDTAQQVPSLLPTFDNQPTTQHGDSRGRTAKTKWLEGSRRQESRQGQVGEGEEVEG